jgi:hypothetical protein
MAFRDLPRPAQFRTANPHLTVGAFKSAGKYPQTVISIPREMLRAAGISDIPGDKLDVLVGEGDDAGKLALIPGSRSTLGRVGNGKNRVCIAVSGLARALRPSAPCAVQVGVRQLVFTLPAGFAEAAPAQLEVAA